MWPIVPRLVTWLMSFDRHRGLNQLAQGGVNLDRSSITRKILERNINRPTLPGEHLAAYVGA
jgi:hypothetical protein